MKLLLSALFFTLVAFSTSTQAQNDYYPLEKGKTWSYMYSNPYGGTEDQKAKVEIADELKVINGKKYYAVKTSLSAGEDSYRDFQTVYMRNGKNGSVWGISPVGNDPAANEELMFLPEGKLTADKSWNVSIMGVDATQRVLSMNGTIETPVKTYTGCLVIGVSTGEDGMMTKSYMKKDVGMVAMTMNVSGEYKLMQYLK